jgi:hypothetical protein
LQQASIAISFDTKNLGIGDGGCVGELGAGGTPDVLDASAGADEHGCRREGDERQKQRVLDEILALLVLYEIRDEGLHGVFSLSKELIRARKSPSRYG